MAVGLSVCANSTFTLFWSMGVMTMKMINNTSMTSTMGVTLMFELTFLPSSLFTIAIPVLPASGFQIGLPFAAAVSLENRRSRAVSAPLRKTQDSRCSSMQPLFSGGRPA
jgi:hypothetical protein